MYFFYNLTLYALLDYNNGSKVQVITNLMVLFLFSRVSKNQLSENHEPVRQNQVPENRFKNYFEPNREPNRKPLNCTEPVYLSTLLFSFTNLISLGSIIGILNTQTANTRAAAG